MVHSFFNSKRRLVAISSVAVASAMTMVSFQNCAGAKTSSSSADQLSVSASASSSGSSSSDSVSKNMGGSSSSDLPVGAIGATGGIEQFKGSNVLLPGFTISKDEISAIAAVNSDSVNKNVVCKLFARPIVEMGQTASFMIVMFDNAGKENFDSYKDGSGNFFKFPIAGLSHIDFVGYNKVVNGAKVGVRDRLPQEVHRLGHMVYIANDPAKVGDYTRSAEIFDDKGQLVCRTNQVAVSVLSSGVYASRVAKAGCYSGDIKSSASDAKDKKLCEGSKILGADSEQDGNKVAVSSYFGSKEASAQANSRLVAAQSCASGRALVSRLKEASDGSYLVENECLK